MPAPGRISYGIYIWHFVVAWPMNGLIAAGYFWSAGIAAVAATIAISATTRAFLEKPLQDFGRKLAQRLFPERIASGPPSPHEFLQRVVHAHRDAG